MELRLASWEMNFYVWKNSPTRLQAPILLTQMPFFILWWSFNFLGPIFELLQPGKDRKREKTNCKCPLAYLLYDT